LEDIPMEYLLRFLNKIIAWFSVKKGSTCIYMLSRFFPKLIGGKKCKKWLSGHSHAFCK
jgi:hypothetical protein